jgi:hypothetical protein
LTPAGILKKNYTIFAKKTMARLWNDPVFVLLIGMGILGFRNVRFWLDFGMPVMLLWIAREIEALLEVYSAEKTFRRLILSGGGGCAAFFLMLSADIGDRWDNNHPGLHRWFPSADDKDLAGWFPEDGGIFYNRDMDLLPDGHGLSGQSPSTSFML